MELFENIEDQTFKWNGEISEYASKFIHSLIGNDNSVRFEKSRLLNNPYTL